MSCPSNSASGFIELTGTIPLMKLNEISTNKTPLSISISPRTTIPSILSGNEIDDTTGNTCIFNGNTFDLVSIQICSVMNKGYILPGENKQPVAELILSFASRSTNSAIQPYSGILLCIPIYDSGNSVYSNYIDQLINTSTVVDPSSISTLDSIFYTESNASIQTSLAYTTCFETVSVNKEFDHHSLYVLVFPVGIQLQQSTYQTLLTKLVKPLPSYRVPPAIRGIEPTLQNYTMNNGKKVVKSVSNEGYIYTTPISSCSSDFVNHFEYYTTPPTLSGTNRKIKIKSQCKSSGNQKTATVDTIQYKCVPFDKLDKWPLSDIPHSYVIPEGKTSAQMFSDMNNMKNNQTAGDKKVEGLSTGQIEGIIGGTISVIIVALLAIKASSWLSNRA